MTVKVNKTVLKSIWQRPLKSVADADPWGIGRRNLTHSVQGINVPVELDTLLKVFILASLVFQSNPGIRERELHPNPMGHGRVWAISVNLGGHGGCLQRPWFLWPPFRVVLAAGWTEGGIPSACLGHQVSRPLSLWRHPPWQVQIMGVSPCSVTCRKPGTPDRHLDIKSFLSLNCFFLHSPAPSRQPQCSKDKTCFWCRMPLPGPHLQTPQIYFSPSALRYC